MSSFNHKLIAFEDKVDKHWYDGLPSRFFLGHLPINIVVSDELKVDNRDAHGTWTGESQTIDLLHEQPSPQFALTIFLHELDHALHWFFAHEGQTEEEESVSINSTGLAMVLIQNPDLADWMFNLIKDNR